MNLYCSIELSLEHGKLADMVRELSHGLAGIKHEQEYMEIRERMHRMSESKIVYACTFVHCVLCNWNSLVTSICIVPAHIIHVIIVL